MKIKTSDDLFYSHLCIKYDITPTDNEIDSKRMAIGRQIYKLTTDEAIESLNRYSEGRSFIRYSDDRSEIIYNYIIDGITYEERMAIKSFRKLLDSYKK